MSTNNKNNLNGETSDGDPDHQEMVIASQPTSGRKLTEAEELAALGLRPNELSPDPCAACLCCVFCFEMCLAPTGGAPPIPAHKRLDRKAIGKHNWDNDSHDGDQSNDGDFDWAVSFANNMNGDNSGGGHCGDHYGDSGHDCGGDGGGGDGGGGGGGGGDGGGGD